MLYCPQKKGKSPSLAEGLFTASQTANFGSMFTKLARPPIAESPTTAEDDDTITVACCQSHRNAASMVGEWNLVTAALRVGEELEAELSSCTSHGPGPDEQPSLFHTCITVREEGGRLQ